jgi:hypothetical protein
MIEDKSAKFRQSA